MEEINKIIDIVEQLKNLSDYEIQQSKVDLEQISKYLGDYADYMQKVQFHNVSQKHRLEKGQKVICKCPEWNAEGYQIAIFNVRGDNQWFEYDGQPNTQFNETVIAFMPINRSGLPEILEC